MQPQSGEQTMALHAAPASHLLATVGAGMDHILAAIHAEGYQAASQVTSNQAEDETDDPGESASFVVCSCHDLRLAVWAARMDG